MKTTQDHLAEALASIRQATASRGEDLDEVSLELVTAFTALKRAEKKLNHPKQDESRSAA